MTCAHALTAGARAARIPEERSAEHVLRGAVPGGARPRSLRVSGRGSERNRSGTRTLTLRAPRDLRCHRG
ncbi:hypothetical protein Srufu_032730 [Streptomyces libani subsp. rufus]|nr:hypothetical protein Srufu_032730 [Streptomyces libani subsp. rufus]